MDIFSTAVMVGVVQNLKTPPAFLLNKFFPSIEQSTSETIMFDVDEGKRRIAPFVAPHVAGKVVKDRGFRTESFAPAYVKDKRSFDPSRGFKRSIGERIGGNLSPAQRIQAHLGRSLADQTEMLTRRLELMAATILFDGKIVIVGDDYPAKLVDFGRHEDLTIALAGGTRWGEAGVDPIDDLEKWMELQFKHSGAVATDIIVTTDSWKLIKTSPRFDKAIDKLKASDSEALLGIYVPGKMGAIPVGRLGMVTIWLYSDYYVDPVDDTEKPILPAYSVLLLSEAVEGVRHFGAIRDEEAGFQAMEFFPKSWVDKDPSVRWLLMQSAPLPVPYRVNATMRVTVR